MIEIKDSELLAQYQDIKVDEQNCEEILNCSPGIICELTDKLADKIDEIDKRDGELTIMNKDEKQSVQKAILKTDKNLLTLSKEKRMIESRIKKWENLQTNARAFYKSKTLG